MSEARIKLEQYLFLKHGVKGVFLGRFVALLLGWQDRPAFVFL